MNHAERRAFGRRLRDERERLGIDLQEIAESTKIKSSLLAGLERGDLAHWPSGIFRRAFVREYATAIGQSPDRVLEDLARLFPDEGNDKALGALGEREAPHDELRLTLAEEPTRLRAWFAQLAVAAAEVGALVAGASLLALVRHTDVWTIGGAFALSYYPITTACLGRTPALWYLNGGRRPSLRGLFPRKALEKPTGLRLVAGRPGLSRRSPQSVAQHGSDLDQVKSVSR
jgi:transcriptional regulator with XRE-family HTH domain